MNAPAATEDPRVHDSASGSVAIRGGAIRIFGYVSGVLVSLGAAALLVRYLGIAAFGQYVTVLSLVALVGGVTEAGIAVYGIREFAREEVDRQTLLSDLLGVRLALTTVGIAGATCFALIAGYHAVLIAGVLLVGAGLLFQVGTDVLSIPLQADLRLVRLTSVETVRRLSGLVLIALLVGLGAGLLPFFVAYTIAAAAALAVLLLFVHSRFKIRTSANLDRWREILKRSVPFGLAASIGMLYFYVTIVVMSLIASALQTGYFATSFRVTQVALAIPVLALTAVFPVLARSARKDMERFRRLMGKTLESALIFGPWMSIAVGLGASFIIAVLAGRRGQGAIAPLRIQGLVLTASFVSTSFMLGLLALSRYRQMLIATSLALAINVLLGILLIPPLGARGGAIADVATEVLVVIGVSLAFVRVARRPALTVSTLPAVLVASVLAIMTALVPIPAVFRVVVATLIYFGVLLIAGAVPDEIARAAHTLRPARWPRMPKPQDA
jgi:O-antigen/teichoic acid export membrane protein